MPLELVKWLDKMNLFCTYLKVWASLSYGEWVQVDERNDNFQPSLIQNVQMQRSANGQKTLESNHDQVVDRHKNHSPIDSLAMPALADEQVQCWNAKHEHDWLNYVDGSHDANDGVWKRNKIIKVLTTSVFNSISPTRAWCLSICRTSGVMSGTWCLSNKT